METEFDKEVKQARKNLHKQLDEFKMTNDLKKEIEKEEKYEALYITCRSCGCEYLERKEWFMNDLNTKCPCCGDILIIR